MTLAASILALITSLGYPLAHGETTSERAERYGTISEAVAREATTGRRGHSAIMAAAGILTIWTEETRLSLLVHRGERSRWGSDDGRARCMGQLHRNAYLRTYWDRMAGLSQEATQLCARGTLRMLIAMRGQCRSGWAGAFSGYASGSCRPNRYAARSKIMARYEARLWTLVAK